MAATASLTEAVLYDALVNYLISMARTVESAMNRALDAIVSLESPRTAALPGEVFLLEPRINEMEIVIDEHAVRLLRRGSYSEDELRLIVSALKITNDLERIGDLAVNLAQRVITLREMPGAQLPDELAGSAVPEPGAHPRVGGAAEPDGALDGRRQPLGTAARPRDRVEAGGGAKLGRVGGRRSEPILKRTVPLRQDLGEVRGQVLDQLVAHVLGQVGEGRADPVEVAVERRLGVEVDGVHEVTPRSSISRSMVVAKARQTLLDESSWARPAGFSA